MVCHFNLGVQQDARQPGRGRAERLQGVRLGVPGYATGIHESGFAPLQELMDKYAAAGGKVYLCSPCFKKRGLDEAKLIPGATIVGGAKLVEFLGAGSPCVSY